jgi:hypothetical protein
MSDGPFTAPVQLKGTPLAAQAIYANRQTVGRDPNGAQNTVDSRIAVR